MRFAVIGRTEILYESAKRLVSEGHELAAVVTAKEAPEYSAGVLEFAVLAEENNSKFLRTVKINEHSDWLKSLGDLDVAISMNYPSVIDQNTIDCFRHGILNAHGGDLPRYRGNACQAWAIINGEKEIGLCIHKMEGGRLDSGDIIEREYCSISIDTKIGDLLDWIRSRVPDMYSKALTHLQLDSNYVLERQSQECSDVLRCYPRGPQDGAISWGNASVDILRLINASSHPFSGAFCSFLGEKLIIWDARLDESRENFLAVPGQVTAIEDDAVVVATGSGKLKIERVTYRGEDCSPVVIINSIRQRLLDGAVSG